MATILSPSAMPRSSAVWRGTTQCSVLPAPMSRCTSLLRSASTPPHLAGEWLRALGGGRARPAEADERGFDQRQRLAPRCEAKLVGGVVGDDGVTGPPRLDAQRHLDIDRPALDFRHFGLENVPAEIPGRRSRAATPPGPRAPLRRSARRCAPAAPPAVECGDQPAAFGRHRSPLPERPPALVTKAGSGKRLLTAFTASQAVL